MKPILADLSVSANLSSGPNHSHIKNSVGNDLGIDRDPVGTLSQSVNDRVSGPEAIAISECGRPNDNYLHQSHTSKQGEQAPSFSASLLRG